MLQTQVAYWANRENVRHNLATEAATIRDLERKEDELKVTQQDLARKIADTESLIDYRKREIKLKENELKELKRHNVKTESAQFKQAEAALKQAQAALKNAETNRRDLVNKAKQADAAMLAATARNRNATAALQQAGIAAARAVFDNPNTLANTRFLKQQSRKSAQETAKLAEQTRTAKKEADWYGWKAFASIFKDSTNAISNVASASEN